MEKSINFLLFCLLKLSRVSISLPALLYPIVPIWLAFFDPPSILFTLWATQNGLIDLLQSNLLPLQFYGLS